MQNTIPTSSIQTSAGTGSGSMRVIVQKAYAGKSVIVVQQRSSE